VGTGVRVRQVDAESESERVCCELVCRCIQRCSHLELGDVPHYSPEDGARKKEATVCDAG
jgi:hypothetical protein